MPELRWLPDGKSILVDQRWLLRPEGKTLIPFSCVPSGRRSPADCRSLEVTFSPDGARMAVLNGTWLAIGPPQGPLGEAVPIPRWVGDAEAGAPRNVAFWLSNDALFVEQLAPRDPEDRRCATLAVSDRRWRPVERCLEGAFSNLARVEPGPGRWLVVYSGAEGQSSVDLLRYDPGRKTVLGEGLSVTPAPSGSAYVRVHPDALTVDVLSPCRVDQPRSPCPDEDDAAPWSLYRGTARPGPLRLVRANLPPGVTIDPSGNRFAWPHSGSVCVGDPGQPNPSCVPLPAARQ